MISCFLRYYLLLNVLELISRTNKLLLYALLLAKQSIFMLKANFRFGHSQVEMLLKLFSMIIHLHRGYIVQMIYSILGLMIRFGDLVEVQRLIKWGHLSIKLLYLMREKHS